MPTGKKIKEIRTKSGMTQQELAEKAKINLRTLQRIENGEVSPRSFTLKEIAKALNIEEQVLFSQEANSETQENPRRDKTLLVWLHLSSLILLPALLIWFFERGQNPDVGRHGADAINFQLSMLAILLPSLFFEGVPQVISLFTVIVVLVNTIKVIKGKPYHYPLNIAILKV